MMNEEITKKPQGMMEYFMIPIEIFEQPTLTYLEMFVYAIVKYFDGKYHCFANNHYIASVLNITPQKVSVSINKLIKLKILQEVSFDGRIRTIKVKEDYKKENRNLLLQFNDRLKRTNKEDLNKELIQDKSDNLDSVNQTINTGLNEQFNIYNNNKKLIIKNNKYSSKEEYSTSSEVLSTLNPEDLSDKKIDRLLYKNISDNRNHIKPTPEVENIINHWETIGLRKTVYGNKTYKENVMVLKQLLKGEFFKDCDVLPRFKGTRFTPENIKEAITRFRLAVYDKDFEPSSIEYKKILKGYSIAKFIYNPHTSNGEKSWFLKCFQNTPEKLTQKVKIKTIPEKYNYLLPVVEIFKGFYLDKIGGGLKINITPQDENNFIDGAVRLHNFTNDNRTKIRTLGDLTDVAKCLCDAIWEWSKGNTEFITSAKFKSDHTYNKILPKKLIDIGVVEEAYDNTYEY